jgi:hypothetical protein
MPNLLSLAAVAAFVTGLVHSILGERLIFRHLRAGGALVPALAAPPLQPRHVRILWATWHLATALAWALAALLWQLAGDVAGALPAATILAATMPAFFIGAVLVLVGTRGRHPGWIALGVVGALCAAAVVPG